MNVAKLDSLILEINTIYNECCIDTMSRMQNEYIDLVVTSPPYDSIRDYKGYSFPIEKIVNELYRIAKKGSIVVWIVGDQTLDGNESGSSFKQALYFKKVGFNLHDTMIFQKNAISFPENNRYHQAFEYMFIFSKGKPEKINLIKDRLNITHGGKKTKMRYRIKSGEIKSKPKSLIATKYGLRFNIWSYDVGFMKSTSDKIAFNHPAIFPEKLVKDHLISWSNINDLVYDPFMGSGTTAKMCIDTNRKYIGSEISNEYCDITIKRIKPYLSQMKLY